MKAYGHSRRDMMTCKYGCCTTKSGKLKNCRSVVDAAKRKSARKSGVDFIQKQLREAED